MQELSFTKPDEFETFIRSECYKDKLIVIDFHATWCGPCRQMNPIFRKLADMYPDVVFAKIDVDESEVIAEMENVEVMPTFIFYKNGERLCNCAGTNEEELENRIKMRK